MPRPRPSIVARFSEKIDISTTCPTMTISASVTATDVPADHTWHEASHQRAEHQYQRDGGQRDRQQLGAPQVAFGDFEDVGVEDGRAGERDLERGRPQRLLDRGQDLANVSRVGAQRQGCVRRLLVGCDLARALARRDHALDGGHATNVASDSSIHARN